jgi:nucleoside phosphorylase
MPTRPHIPTYFSHSYRVDDRDLNLFFSSLFHKNGFTLSVDPKSDALSIAYLERMMARSACFAAVVTLRPEDKPIRCSPYILFEYGLAVQAHKPMLVLVERDVSEQFFPIESGNILPFDRGHLADDRPTFAAALKRLSERSLPYRHLARKLRGRVGVALPAKLYSDGLRKRVYGLIEDEGFQPTDISVEFAKTYELALRLQGLDFVVTDVGPDALPQWFFAYLNGRFVPTLRLFRLTAEGSSQAGMLPPLIAKQLPGRDAPDSDALLFWHDEDDLVAQLKSQLSKLGSDRTELLSEEEGERYFRSLGRRQARAFISNSNDSNEAAQAVSTGFRLRNISHFHYKAANSIPLGEAWAEHLMLEIRRSELFIPLITPGYWKSAWCRREHELADRLEAEGRLTIIPFFLQKENSREPRQGRSLIGLKPDEQAGAIIDTIDKWLSSDAAESTVQKARSGSRAESAATGAANRAHRKGRNMSVDIAIMTIIPEEYEAVLALLDDHEAAPASKTKPNTYAWRVGRISRDGADRSYRVVVGLAGRAGNVSGTTAILRTVERWQPRYVLLIGIAGGLPREECAKGDVVVSTAIWGYEYGKLEARFTPRNDQTFLVDGPLIRASLAVGVMRPEWHTAIRAPAPVPGVKPKVLVGPVASGEKVVDDVTNDFFKQVLEHWPKLQAIEMEGAGAAAAIQTCREEGRVVGFLMIRGISDMPKGQSVSVLPTGAQTKERDAWKRFAAGAAACFAVRLVREGWPSPPLS